MASLILPSLVIASPWSSSARAAAGRIIGRRDAAHLNLRVGLELDIVHNNNDSPVGFGLEGLWWEEAVSMEVVSTFERDVDAHHRSFGLVPLVKFRAPLERVSLHYVVGLGDYLTIARYRYRNGFSESYSRHSLGLSLGVEVSGPARPIRPQLTPAIQARWHQIFTAGRPTHLVMGSVGVRFN